MFCKKCGKEVQKEWTVCPNCGEEINGTKESEKETREAIQNVKSEKGKKKRPFKKKIIGLIAVIIIIIIGVSTCGGSEKEENTQEASEEIKTLEEAGGFGQWKEDGFPGSVRANISVDFPLGNTDKNNYAVYIGVGGINFGIIMQEDEKPVKEWDWLMNAEPYEETKQAYFNGILKYLGTKDEDVPVFLISDVKEGDYSLYNEEGTLGGSEQDIENNMDDVSDIAPYLTNSEGALPILIENVYLEGDEYSNSTTVQFDIVNKSGVDVQTATFGAVAWDSDMLPLKLSGLYDFEDTYFYEFDSPNIADGKTESVSISLMGKDFKYMQMLLLEYSDFDGNTWENPATSYYKENFAGIKFDENTMTAMLFGSEDE